VAGWSININNSKLIQAVSKNLFKVFWVEGKDVMPAG
jgi:hypothetical protein